MKILVSIALLLFACLPVAAQLESVESITIRSAGPEGKSGTIEIKRDGRGFRLDRGVVSEIYVRMLLDQIEIRTSPSPESAGVTKEWLENRVETYMPEFFKKFGSPAEKELWEKSFTDLELVGKIFPRVFTGGGSERSREPVEELLDPPVNKSRSDGIHIAVGVSPRNAG